VCTEIVEYTAPDEVAVCNLASIGLPMYVQDKDTFDHRKYSFSSPIDSASLLCCEEWQHDRPPEIAADVVMDFFRAPLRGDQGYHQELEQGH
jgi:hypothetical protein